MFRFKKLFTAFCFWTVYAVYPQQSVTVSSYSKNEECEKGAAAIQVDGVESSDMVTITWSNGQTNVTSISNLTEGDYNVRLLVKRQVDTIIVTRRDTTVRFKIEKEECLVQFNNHFTPNGDNYNDKWASSKTEYYPNFQLYVFNKWGQQVHSQKGTYVPWDGTWNGINVPDGTYYYVFYYDGGSGKHIKGDITILR
jgi:gliding motility-associated-like protein